MERFTPPIITATWSKPSVFRVFRARVVDVSPTPGTDRKRIFIQDLSIDGQERGRPMVAIPPSPIPVNDTGGGMLSIPDVGDECLVAYDDVEGTAQILTYTPLVDNISASPYGRRIPEAVEAGGYSLKIGGQIKSVFSMSRGGIISMFTGKFGLFKIDGASKLIELSAKKFDHASAVGMFRNTYHESDSHTGLDEITGHIETYAQTFTPGHPSLMAEETEQVMAALEITKYDSKALIRAGAIINRARKTNLFLQNPYQIESWQSLGANVLHKDTVTTVRFGHQAGRNEGVYKYHTDDFYPPGTLYEIESKTNSLVSTSSMLWRYGKYTDDIKTRSTLGVASVQEYVKGEIYRHQIYDDIIPGVATPLTDPVGAGKGYDFELPKVSAMQQYTDSFGKLETHPDLTNTVWRRHIHSWDTVPTVGYSLTEILGGDEIYRQTLEHTPSLLTANTYTHTVTDDKTTIKFKVKGTTSTTTYQIQMGSDGITISMEGAIDSGSVKITDAGITVDAGLPGNKIILGGSGGEQQLVTKSWVDFIFANHMHPTAATGPPSTPIPIPAVTAPDNASSPFTSQTKAE